jgi:hypothetical protein
MKTGWLGPAFVALLPAFAVLVDCAETGAARASAIENARRFFGIIAFLPAATNAIAYPDERERSATRAHPSKRVASPIGGSIVGAKFHSERGLRNAS